MLDDQSTDECQLNDFNMHMKTVFIGARLYQYRLDFTGTLIRAENVKKPEKKGLKQ